MEAIVASPILRVAVVGGAELGGVVIVVVACAGSVADGFVSPLPPQAARRLIARSPTRSRCGRELFV